MNFRTIDDQPTVKFEPPVGSNPSPLVANSWPEVKRMDWWFVIVPLATLLSLFVGCIVLGADVATARLFFCPLRDCWFMGEHQPWQWFYRCGCTPPLVLAICGLTVAVFSFVIAPLRPARKFGLFLAITISLGPGILVNGLLKPCVGRPRPHEITTFGGGKQFAYMGSNTGDYICKSFPSGHASMGFFFMTPALFFYRCRPRLALGLLLAGATYGSLVGFARIAQGAHYLSDVLGAALCVYATGVVVLITITMLERYVRNMSSESEPTILPFPSVVTSQASDEALAA